MEDQDSQKFYEDILDLGDIIPPAILAQTTGIAASASSREDKTDAEEAMADHHEHENLRQRPAHLDSIPKRPTRL